MSKNKKLIAYFTLPVLGIGMLGTGVVFAQGFGGMMRAGFSPDQVAERYQEMFQAHASLLGMSVGDVKSAWSKGKTLRDLASDKGISAEQLRTKMQESRKTQVQSDLKMLVEKGVITQVHADERIAFMEKNQLWQGMGMGKRGGHHRGGMMGLGF